MSEEDIEEEEQTKPEKRKARVIKQTGATPTQLSEQMMEQPTVPPEVRAELPKIVQELLLKTHELSFEYSTLECRKIQDCALATKSKELFRTVKRLNELMKKVTPEQQPPLPEQQPKPSNTG